ncbi:11192_t:CDS:2 [Funneliformis caledonium]|uniref:11192_t:CDS:1 n=2 Tax=Funneliformis TaxID=1117308 RepID=A0A9N8ZY53_9GLOM|nr:5102_t:CDS:2 [Funneliformis mosseae]CAG8512291.1 11192_t:CDS:2 [Funneliformis caledonium]
MTSKNSQNIDQSVPNNPDYQPTPEPFTSPENPNGPNNGGCLPLAALGGMFIELEFGSWKFAGKHGTDCDM